MKAAHEFKEKRKFTWISFIILVVFILAAAFCLFPLYAMIVASFKPGSYLVRYGLNVDWDFSVMNFDNYIYLFTGDSNYFTWYKNSIIVTFMQVSMCLFFTSMVGYSLAMYRYKGRNGLFVMVMMVMMVPVEILLLGLYQLFVSMGLMNTYIGAILPFIVAPIAIFFFQQYLSGMPRDFMEAARIDGCTEYGIFFRIFMPLMIPAYAAMLILQSMNSWNNFLWPMMVLRTSSLQTLPIGLRSLITPYGNNYDMLIAGSVLMVLPILIVYLFFQRYFLEGMTAGGIKG
ncbi:MAG: carbohydrate ABC transporter permease [Clostridia bacterium]|nr:carbohydrate ABC transporter permease [Clostridia bacterium]